MFTDLFGGAPHARVFDFLAEESELDHTISEIARSSEVARPTVYKVVDDFLDNELIEETRTVGNSRFFRLNHDNPTVESLLRVAKPAEFTAFELSPGPESGPTRGTGSPKKQPR